MELFLFVVFASLVQTSTINAKNDECFTLEKKKSMVLLVFG